MLDVTYEVILGKLNRVCHDAFLQGMRLAKAGGHANVELAHWLALLLRNDRTDISLTLDHFGIDRGKVLADVQQAVSEMRANRTEVPSISDTLDEILKDAWHYATLMFGETQVRSGHILIATLRSIRSRRALTNLSPLLRNLSADAVASAHQAVWAQSDEENLSPVDGSGLAAPAADGAPAGEGRRGTTALARFASDLTAEAASGKMDPIVGRDNEIRQVIDVLMRRRQNNPILTGEAGVGKTAVVEGFAQQIVAGNVPAALKGVKVFALDIGLLQAGASMKGEFEQRLRSVIDEVQSSPEPIILFIDEAHTLIGAGGQAGTGDAANLLKPALARGTLRTVAATTWAEYRRYFEKDPALTRRFQPIPVDEPDVARCCAMIRGIVAPMEKHHKVRIADEAVVAAVTLSKRYIPARQLPDKAVSLLDTASARVAISQATRPPALADIESALANAERERTALDSDTELGVNRAARRTEIDEEIAALKTRQTALEAEWAEERALVKDVLDLRQAAGEGDRAPLADALDKLASLDPERRRMYAHVDAQAIASVVSDWTGIPVGRMVKNEIETVLGLAGILSQRVIGQDHGLAMVAKRIETSRARLDNPNKPIGVFMLCGPSGVGKTETALALAEQLYGGEQNVITINMSEFQEAHTVSTLKGAPPGYVGYGEGGRLTEAVRRKPFSVVLLDEVEKAHPDVHEVFFQVFDKGQMEDGTGRMIDFKNTIILLTSNVGTDLIDALSRDPHFRDHPEDLAVELRGELLKVFPAALLGRMVIIPYFPLAPDVLAGIVRLQLDRVVRTVKENQGARFVYDDAVVDHIVALCNDPDSGGRMIDNIITNSLLPTLSREFLHRTLAKETIEEARVTVQDGKLVYAYNGEPFPEPVAAEPAHGLAAPATAEVPTPPDDGGTDPLAPAGQGAGVGVEAHPENVNT